MRHKILFFLLFNLSSFSQIQTNTLETGFFGPFMPQQNVLWNSIQTKKEAFDKKIQKEYDLIKDCPNKANLDTLNGKLIYEELVNNTIKANKASRFDALGHDYINEQIAKYINGAKSFGSVIISEIGGFADIARDYFKNFKDNFREIGGIHAIDEHAEDVTAVMMGGDPAKFQRGVFVGKNTSNNIIGQYSVSGGIGSLRDYKDELKKDPTKFFTINCSWGAPFQWTISKGLPYWRGGFNGDDYRDRLKDISYKEKEYNQFAYLNNNQAVMLFAAGNHGHRGSEEIDSKIQIGSDIYVDDQNGKKIKIPYGSNGVLYPKPSQITGSINSYAGGKNLITVGATSMLNDAGDYAITEYTSIGPTTDGRIKPDICAEGQTINFNFQKAEGTSFATPLVSSIVSAFSEEYKANNGFYPTATTIKASLINSALDIGDPGPDYTSGWGQCNGEELFRYSAKNALVIQDIKTLRATSEIIYQIPLYYPGGDVPKITAAWMDEDSGFGLNANLDLTLQSQQGDVYLPYLLDANNPKSPATNGIDKINTVEQISPGFLSKGYYTLIVKGESLKRNQLNCPLSIVMSGFLPYVDIDMDVANTQGNVGDLFKIGFVQQANPLDNKVQTVEFVKAVLTNKKSGNNYELSKDSSLCLLGDVCFSKGLSEIGQYDVEIFIKVINTDGLVVESSRKFTRVYEVIGKFTMPTVDFDVPDLELVPGQFESAYINIQAEDTDSNNYPQKFDLFLNYNGKEIQLGGQELKCKGDFISKKIEINFPGTFYFTVKDNLNNRNLDSNKETLSYAFTVADKKLLLDFTQPDCEDNFKVLVKNPSPDITDYEWTKFSASGTTITDKTVLSELPLKNSDYTAVKVKENSKNNYFIISDQTFKKFLRYNDNNGTNFKPTVEEYKQDPTVLLPGDFAFYYDTANRKIISKSNKNYALKFVGNSVICTTIDQADFFDLTRDSNKNVLYAVKNTTTNSYLNITKEGTIEISSAEKKIMLSMGLKSTPSNSDKIDLPNSEIPAISLLETTTEICPTKGTSSFTLTAQATDPSKQTVLQNLLSSNPNASVQFVKDGVIQQNSKSLTATGTSSGIYQAVVTTGSCYKRSEADFVKSCNQEENEAYDNTPKPGPGGGALVAIAGAAGGAIASAGQFVVGILGGLFAIPSGFVPNIPNGNVLKTRFNTLKIEDNVNTIFTNSYNEYKDYDLGASSKMALTSGVDYYFSVAQINNDGTNNFNKPKFFIDLNNDGVLAASEDVLFKSVLVSGRYKFTLPTNLTVNTSTKALFYASSSGAKQEILLKLQLEVKTKFTKIEVKETGGTTLFTYNFPNPYSGYANYDISSVAPVAIYTTGQTYQFLPNQINSDGTTSYDKPKFFVDLNGDGTLQNSEDLLLNSSLIAGRYDFQLPPCYINGSSVLAKYVAIAGTSKQEILFKVGLLKTRFDQITITNSSGIKIYDKRFVGAYSGYSDFDLSSEATYSFYKVGETYKFISTQQNGDGTTVYGKPKFFIDLNADGILQRDEDVLLNSNFQNGGYNFQLPSSLSYGNAILAKYVAISGSAKQEITLRIQLGLKTKFNSIQINDSSGVSMFNYNFQTPYNDYANYNISSVAPVVNYTAGQIYQFVSTQMNNDGSQVFGKPKFYIDINGDGILQNDEDVLLNSSLVNGYYEFQLPECFVIGNSVLSKIIGVSGLASQEITLQIGLFKTRFNQILITESSGIKMYDKRFVGYYESYSDYDMSSNSNYSILKSGETYTFSSTQLNSNGSAIFGKPKFYIDFNRDNNFAEDENVLNNAILKNGNYDFVINQKKTTGSYKAMYVAISGQARQKIKFNIDYKFVPNFSIAISDNPKLCVSDSHKYLVNITGDTAINYQYIWYLNNVRQSVTTSDITFTGTTLNNRDVLKSVVFSDLDPTTIKETSIVIEKQTSPSNIIINGLRPFCSNDDNLPLILNVTGGTGTFIYKWFKNGVKLVEGTDMSAFAIIPREWSNDDRIKASVSYQCALGNWVETFSQEYSIVKNVSPSVVSVSGLRGFCNSDSIILSANVTGGSGKFYYYWTKNGTRVSEGYENSNYTL
ncbi:S8 family serine peptidase, partial [Flavobacterium oreochromis]|uniref:S8 family serine peptidase n=2 Tax=Flavobacterium oreochromis TaxID=2906078 RepID=UPI003858F8D2